MTHKESPIEMLHAHEKLCAEVATNCAQVKAYQEKLRGPYGVIPCWDKDSEKQPKET